jgi:Uma2 family endonuclease
MTGAIQVKEVYYPESDGKPMGETDDHREAMVRHIELLQDYYRGQNVYVSGDLLVYYVQGNPRKFIVPDAFVVKGIPPGKRRTYKIWVEGKAPDMVIETTSRKTRKKDMQEKPDLYEQLGVKEYFLFDPHQEYLVPQLQGYRLTPAGYRRIEAGTGGELISVELGLRLSLADGQLQFHRLDTGERLLTRAERAEWERAARQREAEARQHEAEARQREMEARLAAEAEVVRLRAELARLRPPGT